MDEVIKDVNEGWDEEVTAGERASGLQLSARCDADSDSN